MDEESIRRSITPKWASYKRLFARSFIAAATVLTVVAGAAVSLHLYNRLEKIKSLEYLDVTIKKESLAKIGSRQMNDFNYVFQQVATDQKALKNGYLTNFLKARDNVRSVRFFTGDQVKYSYDKDGYSPSRYAPRKTLPDHYHIDYEDLHTGVLVFADIKSGNAHGQLQILFSAEDMLEVLESIYVPNLGQTAVATVYGTVVYPERREDEELKNAYQELFLHSSGQRNQNGELLTYEIAPPFEESMLENQDTAHLELAGNTVSVRFTPLFVMSVIRHERIVAAFKPVLALAATTLFLLLVVAALATLLYARLRRRNEIADQHIIHQKEAAVEKSRLASLGEMAASIAHEINNPLSIIMFNAELLEATLAKPDPTKQKEFIQTIFATVDRASKIVKGLKSLGRDGSSDPMSQAPIQEIVDDALSLVEMKVKKHKVELRVDKIPPYYVNCRPGQVAQVLINLISNSLHAIQFSRKPWIHLAFAEDGDWYYVNVTDCGRGIPEDVRKRIFEPFFTTKGLNQGTGLGLSLSRKILEDHGGDLTLDTACPNTRFVIKLPRKKGEQSADSTEALKVRSVG